MLFYPLDLQFYLLRFIQWLSVVANGHGSWGRRGCSMPRIRDRQLPDGSVEHRRRRSAVCVPPRPFGVAAVVHHPLQLALLFVDEETVGELPARLAVGAAEQEVLAGPGSSGGELRPE